MSFLRWFGALALPKPAMYGSASDWATDLFPLEQRQVAARVAEVLLDRLNVPLDDITEKTRFIKDLRMDDFEATEVLTALEARFQISISEADAQNLETVSDLVRYLCEQRQTTNS